MGETVSIFWFRRDLRLDDNVGLYHALNNGHSVIPIFIFDKEILDKLPKDDARVSFIHKQLLKIRKELQSEAESSLAIYHGKPLEVFKQLTEDYEIQTVFTNHDYEPYAQERDKEVSDFLESIGIGFKTFKDQVIFEKEEVAKNDGDPYVVYTPYKNKWKERFNPSVDLVEYEPNVSNFIRNKSLPNCSLQDIGFEKSSIEVPDYVVTKNLIQNYEDTRNFPAIENGTSRLG